MLFTADSWFPFPYLFLRSLICYDFFLNASYSSLVMSGGKKNEMLRDVKAIYAYQSRTRFSFSDYACIWSFCYLVLFQNCNQKQFTHDSVLGIQPSVFSSPSVFSHNFSLFLPIRLSGHLCDMWHTVSMISVITSCHTFITCRLTVLFIRKPKTV